MTLRNSRAMTRRDILRYSTAVSLAPFVGLVQARAAEPIRTAAIYTVPVEQQWVSRIHKARMPPISPA